MAKSPRTTISFPDRLKEELSLMADATDYSQNDVIRHAAEFYISTAKLALAGVPLYVKDETNRYIPIAIPGVTPLIYTRQIIDMVAPDQGPLPA